MGLLKSKYTIILFIVTFFSYMVVFKYNQHRRNLKDIIEKHMLEFPSKFDFFHES